MIQLLLILASAMAQSEFDGLGGNAALMARARALDPEAQVSVVQNRAVDRRHRVEIAPEISGVFGGDTYNRTRSMGLNAYYHLGPRWAVGAKYQYSFNQLTAEGQAQVDRANDDFRRDPENPATPYPDIDYAKGEYMALANWFPLYGKFSLLDRKVLHFDVYALAGIGRVLLRSGDANTWTAGAGLGLWATQHFTTRTELRYQSYTGQYLSGARRLDLTVASLQMGWLL